MATQRQGRRATTEAFLDRHAVFSRSMFARAHDERSVSSALAKRLNYLQATGRIVSLERGLYATVRPGETPDAVAPDPYLVGAVLRPDGIFAYHSALALLGVAHSDWRLVTLVSHRRRRPLDLRTGRIEVLAHPTALRRKGATELGVRQIPYLETTIRITGRERTLVDGFHQLRRVGGLEELVTSAAGFPSLDFVQLEGVLQAYDQRVLYAAVGWFLETYQSHFHAPDSLLLQLARRRPNSPHYLPRRMRSDVGAARLVADWNIILPEAVVRGAEQDES